MFNISPIILSPRTHNISKVYNQKHAGLHKPEKTRTSSSLKRMKGISYRTGFGTRHEAKHCCCYLPN